MTRNTKPNTLPAPLNDMDPSFAPLVIDKRLSKGYILDLLTDYIDGFHLDADARPIEDRSITHTEIARLAHSIEPDGRPPNLLAYHQEKEALLARVADHYGFDIPDAIRQDEPTKSNLVHMLLYEVNGEAPPDFSLPSDPDSVAQHNPNHPRRVAPGGGD